MFETWLPDTLLFWHWWIFGVLCLMLELALPGVFFLWIGLAAGAVGLGLMVMPSLGWEVQALAFAILSVASTIVGRRLWRPGAVESDQPFLNRRASRSVGSVVMLTTDLEDGRARVRVGDGEWMAVAKDQTLRLPRGSHVRVMGERDGMLEIQPLAPEPVGAAKRSA